MKNVFLILLLALTTSFVRAEDSPKPITADTAAKMINAQVVVEMEVKSASLRQDVCFLNSNENHRDMANFTIFIGREVLAKFKEAKVEDPAAHFKGKVIRVKGKVTLYREKPQITLNKTDEIEIVEKKNKKE